MKSGFTAFVLTAALLMLHSNLLPSPWPAAAAPQDGGIAARHEHEDKAALEKELGLGDA